MACFCLFVCLFVLFVCLFVLVTLFAFILFYFFFSRILRMGDGGGTINWKDTGVSKGSRVL